MNHPRPDSVRPSSKRTSTRRILKGLASLVAWLACLATLGLWLWLYFAADIYPWATIAIFGPRWPLVVPILLGVAVAFWVSIYEQIFVAFCAGVALFGLLNFAVPVGGSPLPLTEPLRIVTINMQGGRESLPGLAAFLHEDTVDVVFLQELRQPGRVDWPEGWKYVSRGGLVIGSRWPIEEPRFVRDLPEGRLTRPCGLFATLLTPSRSVSLCCVHFRTPRIGLIESIDTERLINPEKFATLIEETELRSYESNRTRRALRLWGEADIIAGDFNMPLDSNIFRRDWGQYSNAFSQSGLGVGHTKFEVFSGWQVRARIDHVLLSSPHRSQRCWVGPDVGSDHRPVFANITLR